MKIFIKISTGDNILAKLLALCGEILLGNIMNYSNKVIIII